MAEDAASTDVGGWRDVLEELPKRIHDWMPRLAAEGVVGADAIFACLGPALEIFSRYARVEKASGEEVKLKDYLEYVWAAVAREALGVIFTDADASGFEADARLTAMWLWTLFAGSTAASDEGSEDPDVDEENATPAKNSGYVLEYDAARKIAQGLGAHLDKLRNLIEVKGSTARLLSAAERTKYLFGDSEPQVTKPAKAKRSQPRLPFGLGEAEEIIEETSPIGGSSVQARSGTILDRVHQTMLLFATNRGDALRRLLVEDGIGNDARYWSLAQAFSALYPAGSEEKRWVDGVLARKKGLGF